MVDAGGCGQSGGSLDLFATTRVLAYPTVHGGGMHASHAAPMRGMQLQSTAGAVADAAVSHAAVALAGNMQAQAGAVAGEGIAG